MPEISWEGGEEKSSSDKVPGGVTTCSMHAASASYVPIHREANSNNFDTYSTDVAFGLLQHCCRGQEAERLLGSPLRSSYPTCDLERWVLLKLLQTSATAQEPWHDGTVRSAAQTTRVYLDVPPVYSLLSIPSKVLTENGYSLALCFLQKMVVTFLSQNKTKQKNSELNSGQT